MKKKLTGRESIFVSSMLFGLFFGAGNLIFPVSMGQNAGSHSWIATIGFCITAVGLPVLGIASLAASRSESLFHMGSLVGKFFAYAYTLALYLTIGPFFAIPRTATVSFQVGVAPLLGDNNRGLALSIFSLLFFAIVLFFSLKPNRILDWVGKILNPLFLTVLAILVITALLNPMGDIAQIQPQGAYASHAFFTGLLEGYNTMDALASLAFGVILVDVIRGLGVKEPSNTAFSAIKSGIYAGVLMIVIYLVLTLMGAQSGALFGVSEDGGVALFAIANHYFGTFGGILLGAIITLACLKTSIGLITSISTTFTELFPKSVNYKVYAIAFTVISFLIANAGLNAIITVSVPVLMFLYPLTIMLMVLGLLGKFFSYRRSVFVVSMIFTAVAAGISLLASLVKALGAILPVINPVYEAVHVIETALPLSSIGLGWVIPAIIGVVIGLCMKSKSAR
ncbi:branched-chain amino acid transport system II carrier protein [Alloscardovia criceti]|uniref:branched-chain amino acid transport system II carrier protein n=1 Tax=Alloscardovia criceti TaxID=356828 RepID=UPI000381C5F2|nr:branched-chain amino acid transport system II carrier protein [Alloscardovia criceti]